MKASKIVVLLFLLGGCQSTSEQLAPASYLSWMEGADHGWLESKELGDFEFEVFLHPQEYQLLKETPKGSVMNQAEWDSLLAQPQAYQYATLRIKSTDGQTPVLRNGVNSQHEYEARIAYLAFAIQQDLSITQGEETVPCRLFHFERSFDLAPFITCTMAFPAFKEPGAIQFQFNDQHFGNGPVRLAFSQDRFLSTPTVKYTSYASSVSQ